MFTYLKFIFKNRIKFYCHQTSLFLYFVNVPFIYFSFSFNNLLLMLKLVLFQLVAKAKCQISILVYIFHIVFN